MLCSLSQKAKDLLPCEAPSEWRRVQPVPHLPNMQLADAFQLVLGTDQGSGWLVEKSARCGLILWKVDPWVYERLRRLLFRKASLLEDTLLLIKQGLMNPGLNS